MVELTETSFLHSAERTEREIYRLHNQGVRIAIDDFGTGYSSLSYIRQMSLDLLKIDRSFISGMQAGSTDARLVQAMIDMSHAMGLTVVAEGIESEQDLRVLLELGLWIRRRGTISPARCRRRGCCSGSSTISPAPCCRPTIPPGCE